MEAHLEQKKHETLQEALQEVLPVESKDRNIADILDFSISASNKSNGTTLAWSSSASSSSSSSSTSSALSTRVSSLSEMEEEQLIQKVVIVMYLQNIRYLKPRKAVPKSIDFYQHILQITDLFNFFECQEKDSMYD